MKPPSRNAPRKAALRLSHGSSPASGSEERGGRSTLLWGAALFGLVLVTFTPALRAELIWDDDANIIENATLRSLEGLRQMWFVPRSIQQYYPLMYTSYWLEYQAWGLHPFGYHLVNILLHGAAAVSVWRVLLRLQVPGAWLAAAIFAVHPVEVESVAWVTERKNVLSLSLALMSMLAYFRFAPLDESEGAARSTPSAWRWYGLSLLLFALALFAKTVVVTLPPVLIVIYWWKRGRIGVPDLVRVLPFFALSVAMGAMTTWMETEHVGAQGEEFSQTPLARVLLAGRSLWFYAAKLVWPYPLAFFYPRFSIDVHVWWQYLFPAAAIAVPIALWYWRARIGRGPLAAVLIYAGVLFPMLGFFNIYYTRFAYVSDHFQYHASIALIALAAAGATGWAARLTKESHRDAQGAAVILLAGLAALSFRQTFIYHDLETLYRDTIAKNSQAWLAYQNLSTYVNDRGQHDEALRLAHEAMRWGAHEPSVHNNLGVFLFQQGQREGFRPGQLDEAIGHLRQTLQLDPHRIEARKNLALALQLAGKPDEAFAEWNEMLRENPARADAHFELGNLLIAQNRPQEAAGQYSEAVRLQPDYVDALHNLGAALLQSGDAERAIPYFERVLRLQPDNAAARANLERARSAGSRGAVR